MSDSTDPRKRSPSLGQKIITKVKKTVRSLSGNSERRPKFDGQETNESLPERLHREKLERDQAERNRSNTESFLQSGRNGPCVVQTRNGPRAVQEPTRGPSPQRNRLEREAARRAAGIRPTTPPRGRSPTNRERRPGTTAGALSPRHRHRTVTHAISRPGATVRFKSPPRGASSFNPGSPPRYGPSPLATVSPRSKPRPNSPPRDSSWNGPRNANNPSHLHPDRFTAEAWPAPNTGVYGPHVVPGARAPVPDAGVRAPAPNTGVQALAPIPGLPNLAAEGLHGIRGLPTSRKPVPAVIKRAAASEALRGPGIEGSRLIEPGLEFRPVSARVSLVSPTPPPGPESPEISPLAERFSDDSHVSEFDLNYKRIVADQAPVLRTPTVLQHDSRHNRFSGRALANMHVNLCENCNSRPRSENSLHWCHSCENLLLCPACCHDHHRDSEDDRLCKSCGNKAIGDSPLVSPVSPQYIVPQNTPVSPVSPLHNSSWEALLCPHCRKNPVDIPGARFCRACERQLGYKHVTRSPPRRSSGGDDEQPPLGRPSTSPHSSNPRPTMADRAHTAAHGGTSTRAKNPIRSDAPNRPQIATTLGGPFSPGIPVQVAGSVPTQKRKKPSPPAPTPPLKDAPYLRANPQLTARHRANATAPFPKPSAPLTQPSPHTHGPSTAPGAPPPVPTLAPVRGVGTPFEVRGSKPAFRVFNGSRMNESDGEFQRLIEARWRLVGANASEEDVCRAVEEMRRLPRGEVEMQRARAVWDDEWLVLDRHERPRGGG
ncbi:hypothetical protein MMC17_000390 [Xylographa soralifera]|nr:hypothetical protein [Xylographa soralifera]